MCNGGGGGEEQCGRAQSLLPYLVRQLTTRHALERAGGGVR